MYFPGQAPTNPDQILEYLETELRRISEHLQQGLVAKLQLAETNAAPAKPRDGMLYFADGTNWNPGGTGRGVYAYVAGAWVKL